MNYVFYSLIYIHGMLSYYYDECLVYFYFKVFAALTVTVFRIHEYFMMFLNEITSYFGQSFVVLVGRALKGLLTWSHRFLFKVEMYSIPSLLFSKDSDLFSDSKKTCNTTTLWFYKILHNYQIFKKVAYGNYSSWLTVSIWFY